MRRLIADLLVFLWTTLIAVIGVVVVGTLVVWTLVLVIYFLRHILGV